MEAAPSVQTAASQYPMPMTPPLAAIARNWSSVRLRGPGQVAATPFDTGGLAEITQALLNEGFAPAEIRQVMGGNVMRLLSAVLSGS